MATHDSHIAARLAVDGVLAVEDLGQDAGRRRLAGAPGPAEQVGVADAVLAHRVAAGPAPGAPGPGARRSAGVGSGGRATGRPSAAEPTGATPRPPRARPARDGGPGATEPAPPCGGQAICGTPRGSAESCCLPALTRFTGSRCTGPDHHMRERVRGQDSLSDRTPDRAPSPDGAGRGASTREGCESGRIGTLGKRVWGNPPWVRIPLPPLRSARCSAGQRRGTRRPRRQAPPPPDDGQRCLLRSSHRRAKKPQIGGR